MMDFGRILDGFFSAVAALVILCLFVAAFFGIRGCNSYERGYNDGVRDALSGKVHQEIRIDTTTVIIKE